MRAKIFFGLSVALSTLAVPASADTIYLIDGSSIEDVTVQSEKLDFVTYKKDKKTQTTGSDGVLYVEFTTKPQDVDQADAAIADELLLDALDSLENFLSGMTEPPRRNPWAFGYSLYRLTTLHGIMGELDKVVETVDHLTSALPDSRYVPLAQLLKIQALNDGGKDVSGAIESFKAMIETQGLGDRWRIEADLAGVIFDGSLDAKAKVKALEELSSRAGVAYPMARNRAEVALGEEALRANNLKEALKIFKAVTSDPKADSRTLAAAYLGLGDCYWQQGESRADEAAGKEDLQRALTAYMRIVVVHKSEQAYVPKAMFFAGRCFQLIDPEGSQEHANKLYTKLARYYKGNRWTLEAKGFRK